MIAGAVAASSAREMVLLYLRLLGSRNGICLSKGEHLILCPAFLRIS
jgi:hypothetical protein